LYNILPHFTVVMGQKRAPY